CRDHHLGRGLRWQWLLPWCTRGPDRNTRGLVASVSAREQCHADRSRWHAANHRGALLATVPGRRGVFMQRRSPLPDRVASDRRVDVAHRAALSLIAVQLPRTRSIRRAVAVESSSDSGAGEPSSTLCEKASTISW